MNRINLESKARQNVKKKLAAEKMEALSLMPNQISGQRYLEQLQEVDRRILKKDPEVLELIQQEMQKLRREERERAR